MYKRENKKVCKECGGKCCLSGPCTYSPKDIRPFTAEHILSLIRCKGVVLSYEQFGRVALLRPRREGEPETTYDKQTDGKEFGTCIHLTKQGCELPYKDRPKEGRALKVKRGSGRGRERSCRYPANFRERLINEWANPKYQIVLDNVLIELNPEAFVRRVQIKEEMNQIIIRKKR